MTQKIVVHVDACVKDLVPDFLENRRRDLERMRAALAAGDLAAIRDVGQNIRCFSRVYGFDALTELGEEIRCAADEGSMMQVVRLQGQLADYLSRVELGEPGSR